MSEPLHLVTQDNQPYGSERRCCERCGRMCWRGMKGAAMRWTDDRKFWNAAADTCRDGFVEGGKGGRG